MNKPSDSPKNKKVLRDKIVGLGERSVCKSYYPQLQHQIEELKRSKDALEEARKKSEASEARLQSLITASPVGIGVVVERRFQFVNLTLSEMLGYPKAAFIGKNTRFVYSSDEEYHRAGKELYRQIRDFGKGDIETRCQRRDGTMIDVLMSACPVDPDDKSGGITFTLLDISIRKKTEQALRRSEEKYKQLVENINETIFVTDLQGLVTFISPAVETMLGYTPEEIVGKPFINFVYINDVERIRDRFQSLVSGGGGSNEYRFVNKSGRIVWIRTSSRPTYTDERISGTMGTIMDITEWKTMEAELQQSRKMEAIGTLAGGIAHDFNNILSAIIGYVELSLKSISGQEDLSVYLNEVLNAGTRARDLVKQILTFSRQHEDELSDVWLGPVVKETLKFLRSTLPTTIEIRQQILPEGIYVRANPTQIHQILMNLCTNAVHAMEKTGGVLEIRLELVEPDAVLSRQYPNLDPGKYAKLTVADTGHGIPSQALPSIFDPYFTTKKAGEGTGLGLSVVYGIIKALGGEIVVQSDRKAGAAFDVFLPTVQRQQPARSKVVTDLPTGNEAILVVDDEQVVALTNKLRLEQIGYRVTIKTDSREALDLFHAEPDKYDLVITDMTMPKMTGDVLAMEMMKVRPDLPVILCTGYNSKITGEKAEKIGIRDFLMKPVMLRDLAVAIRKTLDDPSATG